jgi:predicted transcriptional regulator
MSREVRSRALCSPLPDLLSLQWKYRSWIMDGSENNVVSLTTEIVAAYVSHNAISSENLGNFIVSVHEALSKAMDRGVEKPKEELTPAVPVKKSVTADYIICLEDGKKFKSLKRHLRTHYDMSPEQYREKWGLSHDYPMVAPMYAAARSQLAKSMGLGRRPAAGVSQPSGTGSASKSAAGAKRPRAGGKTGRK